MVAAVLVPGDHLRLQGGDADQCVGVVLLQLYLAAFLAGHLVAPLAAHLVARLVARLVVLLVVRLVAPLCVPSCLGPPLRVELLHLLVVRRLPLERQGSCTASQMGKWMTCGGMTRRP